MKQLNESLAATGDAVAAWAVGNSGLLAVLGAIGILVLLTLIVLSRIAQGGMAQATADLAVGRPT
jgi:hypothetical protein